MTQYDHDGNGRGSGGAGGGDVWLSAAERDAVRKADVESAWARVGAPLPELSLETLGGAPLSLADFRGHPLLVTFERSVDW